MITLQKVSVSLHEKEILKDISFVIPQSRIVMILGENGSGKTTLIKSMLGKLAYEGSIAKNGVEINALKEKERAALFSYVPQIKELALDMRVEDCVVAGCSRELSIFQTPRKKDYERAGAIMKQFHLFHLKDKLLHEISGGELQMCYVARAFLQDAEVMMMDEPCTYLDYQRQHLFLQETKRLCTKKKSILISIHDPNLALQYADEILLIHHGQLLAHLCKETHDMQKECVRYYNELYGSHFTLADKEDQFLIWKEKTYVADTAICQSEEPR